MESYPADGDDELDLFDFADEVEDGFDQPEVEPADSAETAVVQRPAAAPAPEPAPAPAPKPAAPKSASSKPPQRDNETKVLQREDPEGERREATAPDAVASSREQMAKAIACLLYTSPSPRD